MAWKDTALKAETVLKDGWRGYMEEKRTLGLQGWTAYAALKIPCSRVILAKQGKKGSGSWALRAALSPVGFFPQRIAQRVCFLEKSEWWLDYRALVAQRWTVLAVIPLLAFLTHSPSFPALLCAQGDWPLLMRGQEERGVRLYSLPSLLSSCISIDSCDVPHLWLPSGSSSSRQAPRPLFLLLQP